MSACAPSHSKNGILIETPQDSDRDVVRDTVQCCHCGRIWLYERGSGKVRGFCMSCRAVTCGPHCPVGTGCVPQEQMLRNIEAGQPLDYRPVIAAVPRSTGGVLLGK